METPQRYALNNELHARPFPQLTSPSHAVYLAVRKPNETPDRSAERVHLLTLLDRFGTAHPAPDAVHFSGQIGRHQLKWEMHTEFVTYTVFSDDTTTTPFAKTLFDVFPADWLEGAGEVLTSAIVWIEPVKDEVARDKIITGHMPVWFVPESLAVSEVVDQEATIAGDFRIDENGHVRFAVLTTPGIGQRRLGRIVQRLLEIETYQAASMLTLPVARQVAMRVSELDSELSTLVQDMSDQNGDDTDTLDRLLMMSAEIELLSSSTAYRFGAAGAYEAIVNHRIEVLRETRIGGRQTFGEFMMRRYDPAMRTCRSAEWRLSSLSSRAERAADLLRTRVDVEANEQNSEVLKQMDRRAELQLRLQETVEGLSVVAISYYAVGLVGYLIGPAEKLLGISKSWLMAGVTIPVVLLVYLAIRRIRKRMGH